VPLSSYLRAAIVHPANWVILIGAAGAALLLHAALPLWIAVGVEVIYLAVVPSLPVFQQRVTRRLNRVRAAEQNRVAESMLAELSPNQREHFYALRDLRDRVLENYRRLPGGSVLAESSGTRLDGLLSSFLRLLSTLNNYRRYLNATDRKVLERELQELQTELASDPGSEKVAEVKRKRVEILGKRLERFGKAEESREVVSNQLAGFEDLMRLIHEQSITIRDPDTANRQLESVSAEVEASDETIREMERFMDLTEQLAEPIRLPERAKQR
jgi:hypothetical protein